jgi:hypothetical protein
MYIEILHHLMDAVRRKVQKNRNETAGSSAYQHICTSPGGQNIPCQAQCEGFGESTIFLGLVNTQHFPVSVTEKHSERTICECLEITAKY